jgi:dephospho-CoA kinase
LEHEGGRESFSGDEPTAWKVVARKRLPTPWPAALPVWNMKVIGVVGGIAAGKSTVSDGLRSLGAAVLDADRAGHETLLEPEVMAAARARWGERVFAADGRIDRRKVAEIVFAPPPHGPAELAFWESVTHPRIGRRLGEQIAALKQRPEVAAAVLDAAVLFKAGWESACDAILFVDAPREIRLARARQRGWSEAEFDTREAAQGSLAGRRNRADVIIDNSQTPEHTQQQVEQFWRQGMGSGGSKFKGRRATTCGSQTTFSGDL